MKEGESTLGSGYICIHPGPWRRTRSIAHRVPRRVDIPQTFDAKAKKTRNHPIIGEQ